MFTGLVEQTGALAERVPNGPGARMTIRCTLQKLELGESIAVDGVCLTVDRIVPEGFVVDASSETLARTTLGRLQRGQAVNLERALPLGGRMGGHIVTGHVDGVGRVASRESRGNAVEMSFSFPRELGRYIAEKGSICVSGVSLTVNRVAGDRFEVMLIPHTLAKTSLDALQPGAEVNLEVDILARYVARLMEASASSSNDDALMRKLREGGFV
jgi:riboflavin synthase